MAKIKNETDEIIISKIHLIAGQKVMLDRDLAALYGVTTGNLNKAVKRNFKRFPKDFMFRINEDQFSNLIFQTGISRWGGTRNLPYAFTEQGVAMLSSVLNSDKAIDVNIRIIRIFTKFREMLLTHKDILLKLEKIEKELVKQNGRTKSTEESIEIIWKTLKKLISPPQIPRPRIGFKP